MQMSSSSQFFFDFVRNLCDLGGLAQHAFVRHFLCLCSFLERGLFGLRTSGDTFRSMPSLPDRGVQERLFIIYYVRCERNAPHRQSTMSRTIATSRPFSLEALR